MLFEKTFAALNWTNRLGLTIIVSLAFSLFFPYAFGEPSSEQALFVRRILEFWRDREQAIVKSQIQQFIALYPESDYTDSLLIIFGDILWNEESFEEALSAYHSIKKLHLKEKVFNNRLDCLYHLKKYDDLIGEITARTESKRYPLEEGQQALWKFYLADALLQKAKSHPNPEGAAQQYQQAQSSFKELLGSEHRSNAKFALVEIAMHQGNLNQAVDYYLELAEELPDRKDEMLLRAAKLLSKYSPEKALPLFSQVQLTYSPAASDAAVSKLALLFELGKYEQVIREREEFEKALKSSQKPILDFYLGHSYYACNQYQEAIASFLPLLKPENRLPNHDPSMDKSILLTMASSAHNTNNLLLMNTLKSRFEANHTADPLFAKMLHLQAMTLTNNQQFEKALVSLERILQEFPDFETRDSVVFDQGLALYKLGRWGESRAAFLSLIQKNPESPLSISAIQYLPCATIQMLEKAHASGEACEHLQQQLVFDLEQALETSGAVNESQRPHYLLKLGKIFYDMQKYTDSIRVLDTYVNDYPKDENLFQGHLVLAMCHQEGEHALDKFLQHAEEALMAKPDFADRCRLRLNVFSAYLQLAKAAQDKDLQQQYTEKGAEHLYEVLKLKQEQIKQENRFWLANHYYMKIKHHRQDYVIEPIENLVNQECFQEDLEHGRRTKTSYESALGIVSENEPLPTPITKESLYLEHEWFKLSNVYGWLNETEKQMAILDSLIQHQVENPSWEWTLRGRTVFAKANALNLQGKIPLALENYQSLATTSKSTDFYILNSSKLQWARLSYQTLPSEKHSVDDPEMMAILKTLKDLQIHKTAALEPIHLEAAIDYVLFRSLLEPEDKREEHMVFLFNRIKEDFTNGEDLWSKDYHANKERNPAKNFIYQTYMMLIEAHIARVESSIAKKNGVTIETEAKAEAAETLYRNLLKDKFAISKYLVKQVQTGLDSLASQKEKKE
jgi:tetratricopeptide (TPR) repeat protein